MLTSNQQTILHEILDEIRGMMAQEVRTQDAKHTVYPQKLLAMQNIDALKSIETLIFNLMGLNAYYDETVLPMWWIMVESLKGKNLRLRLSTDTSFIEHQLRPIQIGRSSLWANRSDTPLRAVKNPMGQCPCGNEITTSSTVRSVRDYNRRLLCGECSWAMLEQIADDKRAEENES